MNKPLRNIQNEAYRIRLSEHEKAHMRAHLRTLTGARPVSSPYFFFAPRFAMTFAVFLILIVGTSTTYAAQGALPGNILYPVKIFNENVQGALAISPEAQVSFNTSVAQERL